MRSFPSFKYLTNWRFEVALADMNDKRDGTLLTNRTSMKGGSSEIAFIPECLVPFYLKRRGAEFFWPIDPRRFRKSLAKFLAMDFAQVDDFASLKEKHAGQRVVVMGCGPSLNMYPKSEWDGAITIGINNIFPFKRNLTYAFIGDGDTTFLRIDDWLKVNRKTVVFVNGGMAFASWVWNPISYRRTGRDTKVRSTVNDKAEFELGGTPDTALQFAHYITGPGDEIELIGIDYRDWEGRSHFDSKAAAPHHRTQFSYDNTPKSTGALNRIVSRLKFHSDRAWVNRSPISRLIGKRDIIKTRAPEILVQDFRRSDIKLVPTIKRAWIRQRSLLERINSPDPKIIDKLWRWGPDFPGRALQALSYLYQYLPGELAGYRKRIRNAAEDAYNRCQAFRVEKGGCLWYAHPNYPHTWEYKDAYDEQDLIKFHGHTFWLLGLDRAKRAGILDAKLVDREINGYLNMIEKYFPWDKPDVDPAQNWNVFRRDYAVQIILALAKIATGQSLDLAERMARLVEPIDRPGTDRYQVGLNAAMYCLLGLMELRQHRPNAVDVKLIEGNYRTLKSVALKDGGIVERYPPRPLLGDGLETCHQFAWYSVNVEAGACSAAGDYYRDAELTFDKILDLQHPKTGGFCFVHQKEFKKHGTQPKSLEMWYCCTSSGLMALVKGYRIYGGGE